MQMKNVPLTTGPSIRSENESRKQVCLKLDDQSERVADRVLLRTAIALMPPGMAFLRPTTSKVCNQAVNIRNLNLVLSPPVSGALSVGTRDVERWPADEFLSSERVL